MDCPKDSLLVSGTSYKIGNKSTKAKMERQSGSELYPKDCPKDCPFAGYSNFCFQVGSMGVRGSSKGLVVVGDSGSWKYSKSHWKRVVTVLVAEGLGS